MAATTGGDHYHDAPKSEAGVRTIALDGETVAVPPDYRTARLAWGSAWVDSGPVFTRQDTLGHSMMSLTSDTYTSVYEEVSREGAERATTRCPEDPPILMSPHQAHTPRPMGDAR